MSLLSAVLTLTIFDNSCSEMTCLGIVAFDDLTYLMIIEMSKLKLSQLSFEK